MITILVFCCQLLLLIQCPRQRSADDHIANDVRQIGELSVPCDAVVDIESDADSKERDGLPDVSLHDFNASVLQPS